MGKDAKAKQARRRVRAARPMRHAVDRSSHPLPSAWGIDVIVADMRRVGLPPRKIYATFVTERMVTVDNVQYLSKDEEQEWLDAVAEYDELFGVYSTMPVAEFDSEKKKYEGEADSDDDEKRDRAKRVLHVMFDVTKERADGGHVLESRKQERP